MRYLQKLCDVADWSNPDFAAILRNVLRQNVLLHPKQWELAMIYKAIRDAGKLGSDKSCIGFGTSTECLIYVFANEVRKVAATDLFLPDTNWTNARTNDPRALVSEKAPFPFPEDRLEVKCMDMRDIEFDDSTFDFAWSTCAIEHIGIDEDFIQHFNEVGRVLKPGGVYAFTTAIAFEKNSVTSPGLYFFTPQHLLDIINNSSLQPGPVFDCSLTRCNLNRPNPRDSFDYGVNFETHDQWEARTNIMRKGVVTTQCLLVLRKKSDLSEVSDVQILSWDDTCRFIRRRADILVENMWKDWQYLRPVSANGNIHTRPQLFGSGSTTFKFQFVFDSPINVNIRVVACRRGKWPENLTLVTSRSMALSTPEWNKFSFIAEPSHCYSLQVIMEDKAEPTEALVFAKKG